MISSESEQIFDPLGLVNPITIAKLVLQNLWKLKLGWDEGGPAKIEEQWHMFRNKLVLL